MSECDKSNNRSSQQRSKASHATHAMGHSLRVSRSQPYTPMIDRITTYLEQTLDDGVDVQLRGIRRASFPTTAAHIKAIREQEYIHRT